MTFKNRIARWWSVGIRKTAKRGELRRRCEGQRRTRLEPLEAKDLLNADWQCALGGCGRCGGVLCACGLPQLNATEALTQELNAVAVSGPSAATYPLSNIANLHSRAGAAAKLYLDFNGHFEAVWGGYANVTSPVFDFDDDASSFSDSELGAMQEIWQRVAEDYAPFNIDVTTADPGNFSNGVGLRVSIGGGGSWYGAAGGVAYVNSFTNSVVNTAYVFSANLGNGHAKYVAEAASHEAGHAFGLMHQSVYNAQGALVADYSQGNADWAPVMGVGYYSARSTWANGATTSASTLQDNLAVLSGATNGFGYAADDHGDSGGAATNLTVSGGNLSGGGIIGRMTDVDYFSFSADAGVVNFSVSVLTVGANLDARIELRDATGTLIASADPSTSLSATISANVAAGNYRLVVASHGTFGDLGQYTIAGTVQVGPDLTPPVANGDSASTTTGKPVTINVLGNDGDPNGALNHGSVGVVTGPGHGVVTVDPTTGVVTYTPNAGYVGADSFQYVVRDAAGNVSNVATVTINVTAPVVVQNNTNTQTNAVVNKVVVTKVVPKKVVVKKVVVKKVVGKKIVSKNAAIKTGSGTTHKSAVAAASQIAPKLASPLGTKLTASSAAPLTGGVAVSVK